MSAQAGSRAGRAVETSAARWRGRPVLAAFVRAVLVALPVAVAVLVGYVVSRNLPPPKGTGGLIMAWLVVLFASTVALMASERLTRRFLPLALLLRLSLVFPDVAPSRFRVARTAGRVRDLQAQLEEAQRRGRDDEPVRTAERVLALVGALTMHDRSTRGHSERVRVFTDLVADELDLSSADRDRLRWSALLHDIGKLHIHEEILNKPGGLNDREWRAMRRHPLDGHRIIAPMAGWLGPWARTVLEHHEWYDGTGYPQGLSGNEISLGARIVAVADAYDVMTAARAYRRPLAAAAAREELATCAGTQFDPRMVRAFLAVPLTSLRWALGPLAWMLEIPIVRDAIHAAHRTGLTVAGQAGSTAAAAGAAGGAALMAGIAGGSFGQLTHPAPAEASETRGPGELALPAWGEAPHVADPPASTAMTDEPGGAPLHLAADGWSAWPDRGAPPVVADGPVGPDARADDEASTGDGPAPRADDRPTADAGPTADVGAPAGEGPPLTPPGPAPTPPGHTDDTPVAEDASDPDTPAEGGTAAGGGTDTAAPDPNTEPPTRDGTDGAVSPAPAPPPSSSNDTATPGDGQPDGGTADTGQDPPGPGAAAGPPPEPPGDGGTGTGNGHGQGQGNGSGQGPEHRSDNAFAPPADGR